MKKVALLYLTTTFLLLVGWGFEWSNGLNTADYPRRQQFPNPFEDVYLSEDGLESVHVGLAEGLSLERVWAWLAKPPTTTTKADKPPTQLPLAASYYDFIPMQVGSIPLAAGQSLSWQSTCFKQLSASMSSNGTTVTVTVAASGKADATCEELYMFADRESAHFKVVDLPGSHRMQFELRDYELQDLSRNGLGTYLWPLGVEGTAESLRKTLSLFSGPDMVANNVQFFAEKEFWSLQERPYNYVNLSVSDFQSGDMLAIIRLDGLDPMIAWGTGGTTGHTAIYVDFPDGPHICESTDTPSNTHPYWPPPYGIIRTPLYQWMQQALAADYHVALIPLKPELRARLDVNGMVQFFQKVQGMPYGWHNFIFTFIDTEWNNLPRPITPDLFEVVCGVAERFIPFTAKGSVYNFLIQGLNHRLSANCTTLQCVYDIIDPQNMSLSAATAIPEQDAWRYEGNYSMVCDVFVFEMLQHGGVIDKNIQATEQTPKDVYQMNLWDVEYTRPLACKEADPQLPYCQLMGKYVLTLPGWNQRDIYDNMNEHCGCIPDRKSVV